MKEIKQLIDRLENNVKLYAGYPPNTQFNYSELYEALKYPINNLGDPFELKNPFSTHNFEVEAIKWFLKLYGLTDKNGWGYVTSGGSEGILFGMLLGRETLKNPVVYFSDYAHYACPKSAKILNMDFTIIKTDEKGEMDYKDFEKQLDKNRDAILIPTLGTTLTSAIDSVKQIISITSKYNVKTYIHADAAIDGAVLPFVDTNTLFKLTDGIDSVSISGHKVIGSPIPYGIVLTHYKHVKIISSDVDYVANIDNTITGSRNGFAALMLWYAIKKNAIPGFKKLISESINRSIEYVKMFNNADIPAWRNEYAITVVLNKQPQPLLDKWRMPSNHKFTTLTALPKLTKTMINEMISDIHYLKNNRNLKNDSKKIIFPTIDDYGVVAS